MQAQVTCARTAALLAGAALAIASAVVDAEVQAVSVPSGVTASSRDESAGRNREPADAPYAAAIARATALLPRRPDHVVVTDVEHSTSRLRGDGGRVEAFVNRGQRTVFLVKSGSTLQQAVKGRGIYDLALAAIIWHEMAHIDGASEPDARRAQEDLWSQFVVAGRIDVDRGLRYLALLKKRR